MAKRIDPHYGNNFVDAHVLDRTGTDEDAIVDEILSLAANGKIRLLLPHSVKSEIDHPRTPGDTKKRASKLIFTIPVTLTEPELKQKRDAEAIMRGNAHPGKHDRDAFPVVESAKNGGRCFVTNDARILNKASALSAMLGIEIVTPRKFLDLCRASEGT